ncbi:hypothetical protein DSAG12_02245 [Promethearchaeum syntrophicum]|uniref:Tetratricopeptide repeat protein n=1 Tax=Promethearchaeum syntrophicum TaxID=2594042 RepID=A0A5B9DBR4_9ARCH|nr:hypothetical protein [Candidatus Prometheoarchaeum syntrophicum]QEE16415.1 hypothetical protein DSAG12_02245 [Candidatus Prometheoarchaeum syntrophicum]
MGKEEKIREKGEVLLAKAERYMDNHDFKRSAENFLKAGDLFFELEEWKISEQCYRFTSKNFSRLGGDRNYHRAAVVQRKAANCCLLLKDISKARDYFDITAKSIMKSDMKNKEEIATENVCFGFMCHFIVGEQEEAIDSIKRFRNLFETDIFTEHILMKLVHNLSNAVLNKNEQYIKKIIKNIQLDKYSLAESRLIQQAFLVTYATLETDFSLNLTENEFERDSIVEVPSQLNIVKIKEIEKHKKVPSKIDSLSITNIEFNLSENVSLKEKPSLPTELEFNKKEVNTLPFKFRTNFPGKAHIGPIKLTLEINKLLKFYAVSDIKQLKITSPAAILGINLIPQKTPVINQSFPLQVVVSNNSDGDAMEIDIIFEFPDENIRMMRGTLDKKIYALSPNENIKWQILIKASDVGELPIKTIVSFKDGDGNSRGPFEVIFPLMINL